VPDLITDDVNGTVVQATVEGLSGGLARVLALDPGRTRSAARGTAEEHSWARVARRYLDVLTGLHQGDAATVDLDGRVR